MDTDRPEEPVLPGGHATCDVSAITYPYSSSARPPMGRICWSLPLQKCVRGSRSMVSGKASTKLCPIETAAFLR
jgi:hypothetical protein